MTVIGSGIIEVSADSRKLTAGIDAAKRSLKDLGIAAGDATKGQSQSIDRYVKSLGQAAVTAGKTGRELELYKLALRGANAEQLKAADSALRMSEAYAKGEQIGGRIRTGLLAIGAAAATGLIAAFVAFDSLTKKAGDFQDMAEKIGDTAENVASLAVAAGTAGKSMEDITTFSIKLTKNLTGVDDESKAAGAAIKALGLDLEKIKAMNAADQLEVIGKALNSFDEGSGKTSALEALAKGGAQLLPFLKELGAEGGRQVILTQEQIELADAYSDKQAKLRTELSLHAQAIATQMLPAYNAFNEALIDVAKEILAVEKGVSTLTKDNAISEFAATSAMSLARLADAAFAVAQSVRLIGESYGVAAAMIAAIGRHDLMGANAIFNAARQSGDAMKFNLGLADKLELKLLSIAAKSKSVDLPLDDEAIRRQGRGPDKSKPKLIFDGAIKEAKGAGKGASVKDTAGQEAKAQLALDLDAIKSTYGSLIATYSNSEKIMQAMRSAGLVDDQDYYASKLGFLKLNAAAQEKDLSEQIVRLEQEKLIGKERIDNDKKIAETRAKLAIVKASNTAGVEVNTIQNAAAEKKKNDEIDTFFRDAQTAASNRSIASVESIRKSLLTEQQVEMESHAERLRELTLFNESRVEGEASVNALIEAEKLRHTTAMNEMQASNNIATLTMAGNTADMLYGLMQKAGKEQSALGKAAFLASKAIAVAEIIMNTNVAASKAGSQLGIFGIPMATIIMATGYAQAAMVAGMAIAEASALNGFDIPAGVNPITQLHEKEMVLPQAQANVIRDMAKDGDSGRSGAITIVNNTSAKIGKVTEQTISNGERALIIEEAVAATAAQFGDPNSKTSRAMSRNYATQRSR